MIPLVGRGLVGCGLAICFLGILAFNKCKSFDAKLLVVAIVDGCGLLSFMLGAMMISQTGMSTLKVLLILLTVLIISPLTSHEIARLSRQTEKGDEE